MTEGDAGDRVDSSALVMRLTSSGVRPATSELRPLRERAVRRALRSPGTVPAPPEIHGERIGGRMVRAGDPIDVRLAKYLQHAVREEQWPAGTAFDEFVESLIEVVDSDRSGIFTDRRADRWRVTFVGRSGVWEGLDGGPFIIVLYDCREERLVTAFQPTRGLEYVEDNEHVGDGSWLIRPR